MISTPRIAGYFVLISILLLSCCQQGATSAAVPAIFPVGKDGNQTSQATLITAGSYHLVTVRPAHGGTMPPPIFCSEPSPDFATAITKSLSAGGSAGGASGNASATDSTTITALLGRTAGVVALRDGLYSACEAYANGIIGRDAYALILSQYGDLLTQLAGNGPVAPSASAATSGTGAASGAAATAAANPVAILQLQTLQALVTACITDQDPSAGYVPTSDVAPYVTAAPGSIRLVSGRNPLLDNYCSPMMSKIVANIPALVAAFPKTSSPGTGGSGTTTANAAPTKALTTTLADITKSLQTYEATLQSPAPAPSPAVTALNSIIKDLQTYNQAIQPAAAAK
jgi:hypothetical protein